MLKILPGYIEHHRRYPDSLLAKIFGVFTVKKEGMEKVHLMLMENTMQFTDKNKIKFVFDLKGSTHGRYTKGKMTSKTVRKDLDFLAAKKQYPNQLSLAKINQVLIQTLRRDIHFLKEKNLIDYSLLLAIEKTNEEFDQKKIEEKRRITKMVCSDLFIKKHVKGRISVIPNPQKALMKQKTHGAILKNGRNSLK